MLKIAGATMAGVCSQSALPAATSQQPPASSPGKPLLLAPADATDVAVLARAENLFWCDIMAEHAGFFAMLMPGAALSTQRNQAEAFQRSFQSQYERAKAATFDRNAYAAVSRSTIGMIEPFIEYKRRMAQAQQTGKMRSMVFPLFFDHTAREAERAVQRLERVAQGNAALDFKEVVAFWSEIVSEHSSLIAHMLDPQEQELVGEALDSSAVFDGFHHANRDKSLPAGQILLATEEVIDFAAAVEQGVTAGRIKSILDPGLADHMRRESLKFIDELKRTSGRT
jgi:hypothetical protein